jgi:hypothetical protein
MDHPWSKDPSCNRRPSGVDGWEKETAMAICDTCGNDYDKAFTVTRADGRVGTFDSIECAAAGLAPICAQCGVRILGHGMEAGDRFYCGASCARKAGSMGVSDRIPASAGAS